MDTSTWLGLANLVGVVSSWFVYYNRAGLADVKAREGIDWRQFLLPNLPWFVMTRAKCLFWELILVVWLLQGVPPSRWKALTSRDGQPTRAIVRVRPSEERVSGAG